MAFEHYYALIMAGGGGTRLWPMSRSDTPKQLLPLIEEQSMFQTSVARLAPLFPPERIFVVTGERYAAALREQAPALPAGNFIIEPSARNSGPAAALGIAVISARDPQATVALLTADHHIADKAGFRSVLQAAHDAAQDGRIITLGISPSFPSTAFGYIQRGQLSDERAGLRVYESLGFTEKPDLERAVRFLSAGTYSWNSGMFIWRVDRAWAELEAQQPEMAVQLRRYQAALGTAHADSALAEAWAAIPSIQLDYAVMERAPRMAVIPVDIGWSDVGSWDALYGVLELDEAGNSFRGSGPERIAVDTQRTLVYSDKLTVTIGVQDLVIIDTPDALLICHRSRAQSVKDVVTVLKERSDTSYL